jgi:hypothetical protein
VNFFFIFELFIGTLVKMNFQSISSSLAVFLLTFASASEVLIFEDNFTTFNLSLWKHELTMSGGMNWEFETYANNRSVSFVQNGVLNIKPGLTNNSIGNNGLGTDDFAIWGGDPSDLCTSNADYGCERTGGAGGNIVNPIQSARLRTAETFSFTYGRVEISARLPKGKWLWPAIWMMPAQSYYGQWPGSGEIDIVESRGNSAGYAAGGCNTFGSTLHYGPFWPEDGYLNTHASYTLPTGDLTEAFHTYEFLWNETFMSSSIDGISVLSVPINQSFWQRGGWSENANLFNPWASGGANAPFDQRFYLLINLAVGGTNGFFPDGQDNKPWSDTDQHAANNFWNGVNDWLPTWTQPFQIDYIRVYQSLGGDYAYRLML